MSLAYAQSADFVRFLSRRDDHARFVRLLDRVAAGQPFEPAVSNAYGADLRRLEYQWKQDLARRMPLWSIVGSLVSVLMVALFAAAWWKRRRSSKLVLARWEREEAQMDEVLRQIEPRHPRQRKRRHRGPAQRAAGGAAPQGGARGGVAHAALRGRALAPSALSPRGHPPASPR